MATKDPPLDLFVAAVRALSRATGVAAALMLRERVFSAGVSPCFVHPLAARAMLEAGVEVFLTNFERFRKGEALVNVVDKRAGY